MFKENYFLQTFRNILFFNMESSNLINYWQTCVEVALVLQYLCSLYMLLAVFFFHQIMFFFNIKKIWEIFWKFFFNYEFN
jgi:hypothetical protein